MPLISEIWRYTTILNMHENIEVLPIAKVWEILYKLWIVALFYHFYTDV